MVDNRLFDAWFIMIWTTSAVAGGGFHMDLPAFLAIVDSDQPPDHLLTRINHKESFLFITSHYEPSLLSNIYQALLSIY